MRYIANGKYNRHFELINIAEGKVIAMLDHIGLFSSKAKISITGGEEYSIIMKGFWRQKVELRKGEELICELLPKANAKGRMDLHMTNGKQYSYKHKSFFKPEYGLFGPEDQEIISVSSEFGFAVMGFNYTIDTNDNYKETNNAVLILLLVYCSNYMRIRQNAG